MSFKRRMEFDHPKDPNFNASSDNSASMKSLGNDTPRQATAAQLANRKIKPLKERRQYANKQSYATFMAQTPSVNSPDTSSNNRENPSSAFGFKSTPLFGQAAGTSTFNFFTPGGVKQNQDEASGSSTSSIPVTPVNFNIGSQGTFNFSAGSANPFSLSAKPSENTQKDNLFNLPKSSTPAQTPLGNFTGTFGAASTPSGSSSPFVFGSNANSQGGGLFGKSETSASTGSTSEAGLGTTNQTVNNPFSSTPAKTGSGFIQNVGSVGQTSAVGIGGVNMFSSMTGSSGSSSFGFGAKIGDEEKTGTFRFPKATTPKSLFGGVDATTTSNASGITPAASIPGKVDGSSEVKMEDGHGNVGSVLWGNKIPFSSAPNSSLPSATNDQPIFSKTLQSDALGSVVESKTEGFTPKHAGEISDNINDSSQVKSLKDSVWSGKGTTGGALMGNLFGSAMDNTTESKDNTQGVVKQSLFFGNSPAESKSLTEPISQTGRLFSFGGAGNNSFTSGSGALSFGAKSSIVTESNSDKKDKEKDTPSSSLFGTENSLKGKNDSIIATNDTLQAASKIPTTSTKDNTIGFSPYKPLNFTANTGTGTAPEITNFDASGTGSGLELGKGTGESRLRSTSITPSGRVDSNASSANTDTRIGRNGEGSKTSQVFRETLASATSQSLGNSGGNGERLKVSGDNAATNGKVREMLDGEKGNGKTVDIKEGSVGTLLESGAGLDFRRINESFLGHLQNQAIDKDWSVILLEYLKLSICEGDKTDIVYPREVAEAIITHEAVNRIDNDRAKLDDGAEIVGTQEGRRMKRRAEEGLEGVGRKDEGGGEGRKWGEESISTKKSKRRLEE